MRRILLLISSCMLVSAQDCGPENPSCRDDFTSEVAGSPCWRLSLNGDYKEYCHKGKTIIVSARENDKSAEVYCDGQILDCSSLSTLNLARGSQLERLQFKNCGLNASISCVLRDFDAKGLTSLYLFNWETEITAETLRGLDNLQKIMVFDSVITRIPVEAFKQLPALENIRMSGNSIRTIPSEAFSELAGSNISYIEISRTKITELQSGAFEGLQRLKNLSLFNNEITTVDKDAFKGLPLLDMLTLENNPVHELPAGVFAHNPNLQALDIRMNRAGLRLSRDTLAGLSKLARLEITMYNESYRLSLEDQSLSGLPSLKYCDLSAAGLQELPRDLFKGAKALEELKLDYNELRLLPENVFEDLVNLKTLSLSNNKLQGQIANTSSIYDGPFSTTGKLESLNLARNDLKYLSDQVFIGASSLKTLDLSHNQLNFECRIVIPRPGINFDDIILDDSPLNSLDKLKTLDLSHNNLTSVCHDFLVILTRLQTLNLSHNNIPALTSHDIEFLGKGIIDLRYNQITSIQPRTQQNRNSTSIILLGNNPYNCDCTNFKFLKELKNLNYDMSEATCSEPKSLEGVPLISIAEARYSTSLDNLTCVLPDTPKNCECLARPSKSMIECACDEVVSNLPDPNNITIYDVIDQELTTKYNMLLQLKTIDNFENIPNFVTNLSLSNLSLDTIPNIPEHIRHVDLTYNNLERIPLELLSRNLTFNLSHNLPFKCTCSDQSDIDNLQLYKYKIYDYSSLVCHDGILVRKVQVPHLCDVVYSIATAVSIAFIGIILALLIIFAYKYQLEIRIWLYNKGWTFKNALDASKKYDIFLSYCHEDEDYVVNKLLPFMDAKYKVCVHTRDFIPGDDIMTQIYRAVADSRRTVIVASKAYFKSPWCLEEMRAAYKQTEVDQQRRAVVILRTDVDPKSKDISETIRSYLNLNTWIGEKDPRFWYRLCYFLPRDVTVEDLRLIKVTNEAKKNLTGQLNKVFVHDGKLGIDYEIGEVNGNLARNLCGVMKDNNVTGLKDEIQLAINNLPGGLNAVCNNGKLAKNLPETLNVVNEDGKLVNVAVVKNDKT